MEALLKFWEQVTRVWQTGVLGTNLGDVSIALAVFLGFLFARRVIFRWVISLLKRMTRGTKTTIDDLLLEAIEKPLEFTFVVIGLYVAGQVVP